MIKDIKELQDIHRAYEEKVNSNHKVSVDERIDCKVTALIVEFGELANESESFFKFFKINHRNDKKKKLKEAADCLAYFLGISNDLGLELYKSESIADLLKPVNANIHFKVAVKNIACIRSMNEINKSVCLDIQEDYTMQVRHNRVFLRRAFTAYLKFMMCIDLDFEEVKQYYKDYVVKDNVKRQDEKY